jgi:hypothetical protein
MSGKGFSAAVTWPRVVAYAVAAIVMGVVVGELAAMVIFAGPSGRWLDEQAARNADAAPAVVAASNDLQRTRQARTALDTAVVEAGRQRDEALVVARCEFNPSPDCPQTHITGVPGQGPENRTANSFLAATQRQLDTAVAERDRLAPSLDAQAADLQQKLTQTRDAAIASPDRGFGARWLAMNSYTLSSAGAIVLRALLAGVFIVLFSFPLIFRLSRAQTIEDRRAAAEAEQERADLDADTAIAVKKAEVRTAIETMKADHELTTARLEIEAQHEIDREQQRRRVAAALEAPVHVSSERIDEPVVELTAEPLVGSDNLPALTESPKEDKRSLIPTMPLIATVPEVAKAATRWIRPFVPPIVASAIDTTTKPLRAARQVFEETEEIHFSLRRSHRVSVTSEETAELEERWVEPTHAAPLHNATATRINGPEGHLRGKIGGGGQRELPAIDSS